MSEKMAIAIAYWTDENGMRRWNNLTKDERWFWKHMRIRHADGRLGDMSTCSIVYLNELTPVKITNNWTLQERELYAPDSGSCTPPKPLRKYTKGISKKPSGMDTLLTELRRRKAEEELATDLANLVKELV